MRICGGRCCRFAVGAVMTIVWSITFIVSCSCSAIVTVASMPLHTSPVHQPVHVVALLLKINRVAACLNVGTARRVCIKLVAV
jgi:hypothetical protein